MQTITCEVGLIRVFMINFCNICCTLAITPFIESFGNFKGKYDEIRPYGLSRRIVIVITLLSQITKSHKTRSSDCWKICREQNSNNIYLSIIYLTVPV